MKRIPGPDKQVYVARVWYRDTATWFLVGSFLWFVFQDQANIELIIPHRYHDLVAKIVALVALWIRFQSSTRPVSFRQGTTRLVNRIPVKSELESNDGVVDATGFCPGRED